MRRLVLTFVLLILALPALAAPRHVHRAPAACRDATCRAATAPLPPQDQPAQAGIGTAIATRRPVPGGFAVPPAGYGVIFASRMPGAAHGMAVAETDRLAAFRIAEQRCARGGAGCRLVASFSATCGAVAQGAQRAAVTSVHGGAGPDREAAEADALAECRSRDPGAQCQVVAAQCGSREG